MSTDHSHAPYMKIFVWLTLWTILELVIVMEGLGVPRGLAILGLGIMAAIKASLVGLIYMHLKYERVLIWTIILSPVVLAGIVCLGFYWDAAGYYPMN